MNCCTNCFESDYIRDIILRNKNQGNCNQCGSVNTFIYDATELNIFFKAIIDLYEIDDVNGESIEIQIEKDFPNKIFSKLIFSKSTALSLIKDILTDDILAYEELLSKPVKLKYQNSDFEEVTIKPLSLSWDKFSYEIKKVNRFHFVNNLDLERLKSLFINFEKAIPKGKKFFRARISSKPKSYEKNEMGNPPTDLAKSGRANPHGISYLYLANDLKTTLFEARATLFDYVSVGTFRLEDNISVINLSRNTYDLFRLAEIETLEEVLKHGTFIDKLEKGLSAPRRKNDSELDYLPTQYLSELIKSMGYDGIEFTSSLNPQGYNLAIFCPEKFKCIDVDIYDIDKLEIEYTKL